MLSLFLRNLFFTILQPGIVAGLLPYLIIGNVLDQIKIRPFLFRHYLGLVIFIIGFLIMMICIMSFAVKGRGTLSPADPTKRLVATGLYKFSRNPMYVGVTMILAGEAVFFQSPLLWFYCLFIFLAFNVFIVIHEEPRLKNDFGEEYNSYRARVRRWL